MPVLLVVVSLRVKIVSISVRITISSVDVLAPSIPASLFTTNKLLPELLKLLITVVLPVVPLEPAMLLTSVVSPPALYPGLLGVVGLDPSLFPEVFCV